MHSSLNLASDTTSVAETIAQSSTPAQNYAVRTVAASAADPDGSRLCHYRDLLIEARMALPAEHCGPANSLAGRIDDALWPRPIQIETYRLVRLQGMVDEAAHDLPLVRAHLERQVALLRP